jgi:hypothetical protein
MKFYEYIYMMYIYDVYCIYIYTILYLDFPVSHMAFIKSLIETSIARVYCWDDPRQVNDGTCHQKACFFYPEKDNWYMAL